MSRARDNANLSPTIPDARMPNLTGDVTTSEGAVATTIATDAVDIAMLSATGTASATTFLRGDNSWQTAGSTSASDLDSGTLATARMASDTITNVFRFTDTDDTGGGVSASHATNQYVGIVPKSFTAVNGRHYVIVGSQVTQPHNTNNASGSVLDRWSYCYLYWGTTSRTIGAVQTGDNLIDERKIGSRLMSASNAPHNQYWNYNFQGEFTAASSAPHYVYTAGRSSDEYSQMRMYAKPTDQFQMTIFEVLP
jgi:hypothetical protein